MNIKGIGIDIVQKERLLNKDDLIGRFLNKDEEEILNKLNTEKEKNDFISGRWASKEAIIKASSKEFIFSEISILKEKNGKPVVFINGVKRDEILISISHEKEYTIAFSIIDKV